MKQLFPSGFALTESRYRTLPGNAAKTSNARRRLGRAGRQAYKRPESQGFGRFVFLALRRHLRAQRRLAPSRRRRRGVAVGELPGPRVASRRPQGGVGVPRALTPRGAGQQPRVEHLLPRRADPGAVLEQPARSPLRSKLRGPERLEQEEVGLARVGGGPDGGAANEPEPGSPRARAHRRTTSRPRAPTPAAGVRRSRNATSLRDSSFQ